MKRKQDGELDDVMVEMGDAEHAVAFPDEGTDYEHQHMASLALISAQLRVLIVLMLERRAT